MATVPVSDRRLDSSWIRQSFLLPEEAITDGDMKRRVLTTAAYKFTDTTIGGNFAINAPPQYTRYADVKMGGNTGVVFERSSGTFTTRAVAHLAENITHGVSKSDASRSRGMGRYYSEAMDDNGQYVVMRFGVPEFNSLTSFFGNFYSPEASALARTGKGSGLFFTAGEIAGKLLALPFMPAILGGRIIKKLLDIPATKYYYLKPTMPLYWNAVNTIANGIAVNMGLTPRVLTAEQQKVYENPQGFGPSNYAAYNRILPDIINEKGIIDIYAIATRAQRLNFSTNESLRERLGNAVGAGTGSSNFAQIGSPLQVAAQQHLDAIGKGSFIPSTYGGVQPYLAAYSEIANNKTSKKDDLVAEVGDRSQYDRGDAASSGSATLGGYNYGNFGQFFEGERRDGSAFITFRTDYSGPVSESFSNATKESELAQKLNSMSSSARSTRFNFAGGNIGDGVLATAVEGAVNAVKDTVSGILSGVQLSGLAALAGSAFVDIPKMWDSSTANLPRADYTIELRSPYGNKLSRFQNLYIPLAMLLAGALPLATGKRSYTSPFICELYCRGRAAIRLGMIDSLSITRGVGNIGWTPDGEPLGIDVSFSVVDLSSVLYMPIAPTFTAGKGALIGAAEAVAGEAGAVTAASMLGETWDDDNSFTDYLGVLGALSFQDMVYPSNKWRLNVTRQLRAFDTWRSPAHLAQWMMGTFPGRVVNALALGTDRPS